MLRRINETLPELVLELIVYGLLVQVAGVWFSEDKLRYSTGLWFGIALGIGMAIHIGIVLQDAVADALALPIVEQTQEEKEKEEEKEEEQTAQDAQNRRIIRFSVLRYMVVVIVFLLIAIFHLGNIITCFIGVMGLKVSAYLQPFTHKCILKLRGIEDLNAGYDAEQDKIKEVSE